MLYDLKQTAGAQQAQKYEPNGRNDGSEGDAKAISGTLDQSI